ncbi:MAG: MarR family transcriptional regulator [Firmicutes bacterium]|nr:MarR family transcriptional regulator [Bacillota bacterium]
MTSQPKLPKETFEELAQLRYQMRKFIHFSEEAARKMGLTPQQHQLLLMIKGFPGRDYATPTELAERLQLRHHTCLGLISRTEQLGLLYRTPNEDDHRSVWIHLTQNGEQLLEQLSHIHLEELRRIGLWMGRIQ